MGFFDRLRGESPAEKKEGEKTNGQTPLSYSRHVVPYSKEEKEARVAGLTERETDTFLLLVEGFTLNEISEHLGIKYSTANTHMSGIYKKLGVNSRAELIINYRDFIKPAASNEGDQ